MTQEWLEPMPVPLGVVEAIKPVVKFVLQKSKIGF
jgi:hypothetical protein